MRKILVVHERWSSQSWSVGPESRPRTSRSTRLPRPQGGTVKLSFLAPNEEPPATVTELQDLLPFRRRRRYRP